ncbi:MAG: hypothetical protein KDK64_01520, partial [Chlamydiia bacterium]|nr:hypothetical protein [Chlamydiia bacterium]
ELEQAVHAVAQLSDDFDAQRQMVAVVTMNIARAAGIADGSREMEVLVDQMSHLWLKTTPMAGEMTPLAVINYADKLAQEFDANDLDSVYDKVQAHAALFAQASLTNLSGVAEDDMEALEKATAKFQTQIWDALKANPKFQLKMKLAVRNINQRIGELHNLTTTTDHVSAEVMKRFKGISRENLGTQTGEMHFIAQVMSTYGMTDDVFTLLRAYDGTFDRASGTWERMPLEDVQNAFVGTSMSETLAAVIEENTEAGTVDIFKVFTDDRILGQAAVMQERARLMAQGQTSQISSDEAKRSLFKLFISYSKELTVQYEEALDYLRNEPYPRMAAVNHYQPGEKQVELEGLRRELQSLAVLASQGTTDKPELQETLSGDGAARALNAIATPQGLREDIVDMFAEPYVQSLGIRDPRDIDDTPLQDRYNLQDKDYYRMLETAMGLREANVAGSATLTHETLEFLGTDAAAYILLTQGRLSRKEYSELLKSSSNAKAAHDAVKEALEGITLPVTTRSGKAFFITLPNGEKMELRNFDEEQKAAFEQLLITQRTNFAKAEETESLISSLPPAPLTVDESVESEAPLTPEAILAAIAQDGPEETARRLARMTLRVEELNDSHDSLVAEISAELTNLQVDETKEEAFDTLLQIMGIEEEEENLSRLDRGKIKAALEQSSPEAVAQFMINHLYGKEIDVAVEGTPKNQHDQMREYLRILALSQSVSQKDKAFRDLNALYSEIEQAN